MFVRIQRGNFVLSSVQSLSHVHLFAIPWTAAHQASLSVPTSRACSNSCPSSRWCHPTISSSVVPFTSHLQSFPASVSFPRSQFLASDGQSIGSFSLSISPSNEHSGLVSFQINWFDLLAAQGITVTFCCPLMPIAVDERSLNIWDSCGILSEGRSPCTITFSFFILFFVSIHQAGLCPFTLSQVSNWPHMKKYVGVFSGHIARSSPMAVFLPC